MSVDQRPKSVRTAVAGSLLASFALQAIVAVSGVLAARLLGVTDRGNFALLWLVAIVLAQLGTLSVPAAVTYFVADGRASGRSMLRSVKRLAWLQLAVLLVVHAVVLWGIVLDEATEVQVAALITLLPMPALLAHQYGQAVLQGRNRFRLYNRQRALPMVLYSLGLGGAFVLGSGNLVGVAAIWAGATALGAGSTLVVAWRDLRRDGLSDPGSAPPTRTSLRFGLRSLLGTFTGFEQLLLDQALVALLMSTHELGLYVVAIAFSNLPRLVGQSIGMVAFPAVARAAAEQRASRAVFRFFVTGVVASSLLVCGLELAVPTILPMFFGREFEEAVPVAQILLVGALCQSVRRVLSDVARGAGYPLVGTVAEVCSLAVLLPAALILAQTHGLIGMAVALDIAAGVGLVMAGFGLPVAAARHARKSAVDGTEEDLLPLSGAAVGASERHPSADAGGLNRTG